MTDFDFFSTKMMYEVIKTRLEAWKSYFLYFEGKIYISNVMYFGG